MAWTPESVRPAQWIRTVVPGEARDGILDRLLHGEAVRLMLPAGEGRAVVFDDELVARHVYFSSAKARA